MPLVKFFFQTFCIFILSVSAQALHTNNSLTVSTDTIIHRTDSILLAEPFSVTKTDTVFLLVENDSITFLDNPIDSIVFDSISSDINQKEPISISDTSELISTQAIKTIKTDEELGLNLDFDELLGIKKPNTAKEIIVFITIIDSITKTPISAQIRFETVVKKGKKDFGEGRSNQLGIFKTKMTEQSHFIIQTNSLGYKPYKKEFQLENEIIDSIFNYTCKLKKIEVGDKINLDAVYFNQNEDKLLPASEKQLNELAALMKKNPSLKIQLNGHTDINGHPGMNLQLSENRVKSVRFHLIQQGIKVSRIKVRGFGGTQPITHERDDHNKRLNRRVEFQILKI